jgi:phenylacetic acid degradation operon negative regulatory protein
LGARINSHTIIFSLYGSHVLPRGGEIWIGSLIRAMAALDFSAGAVRALVSRMQRKGFLQSRRLGRRSFYRLTDLGLRNVSWGSERALVPPGDRWDGRWTVVAYSIPERRRKRRDALRSALNSWGFGALVPGTWISPHTLTSRVEKKWQELGVWQYLEIFRAEHLGPSDPSKLVAQVWPQLPAIRDRYSTYIARYEPVLRRFETGAICDEECFAVRLQCLFEFVAITLQDPALPPSLLPQGWPRSSAQQLFQALLEALARPANRFFDTIYKTGGEINEKSEPS